VALPRSTEEVSALLAHCNARGIPLVPQGGLTGLVGAAVAAPSGKELVVSLERMTAIRSISPLDFAIVVEAGCILQDAKHAVEQHECILPITFSAEDTCRIGGNVATNAGGFNVLRYGMTRDLVLGLEVVLSDGRVWNGLKTLRKDNRGYDLKHLFIGSEGTLGIVTAAALKLFPRPTQVQTVLVGLRSIEDAMQLHARARYECSDLLTAFELLLSRGVAIALAGQPDLADLIPADCPVYVLLEASAGGRADLAAIVSGFLDGASDLIVGATIASDKVQAERIWLIRKVMVYTQGRGRRYFRSDVSVPVSQIGAFVEATLAVLADAHPEALAVAYGHVGDGNIHLNVIPPDGMSPSDIDALFVAVEHLLFDMIDRFKGSISAEHGIGRVKRQAYMDRTDAVTLDLVRHLRSTLDPNGIMSDGRIFTTPNEGEEGVEWR
jgi:FAD/FMN-containing dehydrogenase